MIKQKRGLMALVIASTNPDSCRCVGKIKLLHQQQNLYILVKFDKRQMTNVNTSFKFLQQSSSWKWEKVLIHGQTI